MICECNKVYLQKKPFILGNW